MSKLKELGIAFKPTFKKEELEALLPVKPALLPDDPILLEKSIAAKRAALIDPAYLHFRVYDHKDRFVREYTVAIHGEIAGHLAEQFSTKIGGTVQSE